MSDRVGRYHKATMSLDIDALAQMRHPDYECYYPQSGERFRGHENWAQAHRDYASHFEHVDAVNPTIKGGRQKAEVARTASPVFPMMAPVVQISDTGELVTLEGKGQWPDGKAYCWVLILEYRKNLVWRETAYFAELFEAPAWRAPYVEQDDVHSGA